MEVECSSPRLILLWGLWGWGGAWVGDTRPVKEESSSLGQMPVGLPLDPYWYPQWWQKMLPQAFHQVLGKQ